MLHIRYDWRRPVCRAAVCLTFFLSSQDSSSGNNNFRSRGLVKQGTDMIYPGLIGSGLRPYENNLSIYFNIVKR